jgi:hypothetical protein
MNISLAEVREQFDPDRNKKFIAKIRSLGDAEKVINWTSPFSSGGLGTISTPIPAKGVTVLVCQPEGSDSWYYLGSTGKKSIDNPNTAIDPYEDTVAPFNRGVDVGGKIKGGTGLQDDTVIQNDLGCGLELSQTRGKKNQVIHTKTYTPQGKKVLVSDSPGIDSVIMDSNNGSKITVTSEPQGQLGLASQSVQIDTVGPQRFFNYEDQTDILVEDGRELQILNNSTGFNKGVGSTSEHYGNVNLQSKWRDINIFTQAESGRVFIECLKEDGVNQVIELQTHGPDSTIRIIATGKVDISADSVGIAATNSIDIRSEGNLNLAAGGAVNIQSGSGDINADGPQINLNSGNSSPAVPNIGDDESYYGTKGVTTY